jgi:hypothetical protein
MKSFRIDYQEIFVQLLEMFAVVHYNEERKLFKRNWDILRNTNTEIFNIEIERIKNQGYNGNIEKKIFESIRYYYRKKILKQSNNVECKETSHRKNKLCGFSREIKQLMDNHIQTIANIECIISPADAFDGFCKKNEDGIEKEVYRLKSKTKQPLDVDEITIKFKKAYKNRFYKFYQKTNNEF